MNAIRILGLLVALGASEAALADSWDTLGSRHSRDVVRYGFVDDHPGRGHAWGRQRQRSEVNIIVAPRVPATRWAPRWNDRYDYRHDRRRDDVVFNSSLGFIAGAVVGLATAPRVVERNYYVREYHAPQTVIRRDGGGLSISLYKDRFGACYERETDRHGRVIQRRVADYNCDF